MKKLALMAAALLCSAAASFGQFIGPIQPESTYPTAMPFNFYEITHTSNAAVRFNNYSDLLHVYSWSGEGTTSPGGFAWRWTDNTNTTVYDQGDLSFTGLMDIDVTIMGGGGPGARIVAVYYSTGVLMPAGHYFSLFDYTPGSISYVNTIQLSSAGSYGRISVDHLQNLGAFSTVWEDNNDLYVAVVDYNGTFYQGPFNIPNTNGCAMPDIATARGLSSLGGSTLLNWIVYRDASNQFVVSHWDVNDPSLTFIIDDVAPAPSMYSTWPASSSLSSKLNIDCPDVYNPLDWKNYSYVYEDNANIKCRVGAHGNPTASYDLTNGSIYSPSIAGSNIFPTLCYDPSGTTIYYGWWWKQKGVYLAVALKNNGSPSTPGYQIVSNGQRNYGVMTFSKSWFIVSNPQQYIYCAYPDASTTGFGTDMYTKLNPWGTGSFKQEPNTVASLLAGEKHLSAWPNPFKDRVTLQVMNDNQGDEYSAVISDMQGRVIKNVKGTLSVVNDAFAAQSALLPAGTYVVRVSGSGLSESLKIVKQ